MPITVPIPESDASFHPSPDVRETAKATPETFGYMPGATQAISQLGKTAGDIAAFEQLRADQTAVQDVTGKLSAIHTELLTNPDTGLPAYRGVNAMRGQEKVWEQYQKAGKDLSQTLHGEAQKGAFNKVFVSTGDSFLQQTRAHVAKELDRHDTTTFESLVSNKANESSVTYGDAKAITLNNQIVDDATKARAVRLGLDDAETKKFTRTVKTGYHETVLSQMVNTPGAMGQAKAYFKDYQGEMDPESRDRVRNLFDAIPKQQEALAKSQQTEAYKTNMRQAMLDMFDGKLTLSEAQRRYRADQIDKSDYDLLAGKLSKPDAAVMRSFLVSDPETFNTIRQAQLNGTKTPGEIQRMIARGSAAKEITPDDGKYLLGVNSEKPPTPRDKDVESHASNIRDFATRYFAETNFFGVATNKEKTNQQAEALVQDFYSQADKTKASGEDLQHLRDQIKKTAMQKRYPGLGNLDKAPDVVIDIHGRVTRLLSPEQKSGLKPKYRIASVGTDPEEEQ